MKRLWSLISYFLRARKCWRRPRQSDVLIFDAAGQEFLLEYFRAWNPEVLHLRAEQINIPVLIASLFASGKVFDAYADCFIRAVRPRLIVTFIDNNLSFYSLAGRHPSVKTMFVQNAMRSYHSDVFETLEKIPPPKSGFKVDHMLTLGTNVGTEFAKYIAGAVIPIGCLRNNLVPKKSGKKLGTIAFTSQYRDTKGFPIGGSFCSFDEFFTLPDRLVLQFLKTYAAKNGKELFIVPCSGGLAPEIFEREKTYFRKLLGEDCEFTEWRWYGSSYEAADLAEVFVGIDCTLGYESAARGNKTAIFPIRSKLLNYRGTAFGWPGTYPEEGPFWTNHPDTCAFSRILDFLFSINDEQWKECLQKSDFESTMLYDPGNRILQQVLSRELGAA